MYVCIDSRGRAVAWNYDGSMPSEIPQGSTVVEVTEEQFLPLRAMSGPVIFNDGRFVPATAAAGDFMRALLEMGVYAVVDAAVNAMEGDEGVLARVLWARASTFERQHPLVIQIATALGINLDELFILANSYN